jgi:hypothetical protein
MIRRKRLVEAMPGEHSVCGPAILSSQSPKQMVHPHPRTAYEQRLPVGFRDYRLKSMRFRDSLWRFLERFQAGRGDVQRGKAWVLAGEAPYRAAALLEISEPGRGTPALRVVWEPYRATGCRFRRSSAPLAHL